MTSRDDAASGQPVRVGWYRFYFGDDRWEWSPEVQRMHGYAPGTVSPTTELVLSHKHPDDRGHVAATLDDIRRNCQAFSTRHRIVDARGAIHEVIVIGDELSDDEGTVVGTHGFYIDVTPDDTHRQESITAAVAEIAESRAAIEQAKGMLMLIYRVDAERAFELLKWRSQESNVKLRRLAEQVSSDFLAVRYDDQLPSRATYDQLLLTAHHRIDDTG
jgi:ANTAR domain/PAS fold